jgi:S1-C subfamily serine protease
VRRRLILLVLFLLSFSVFGCARTADLIPDSEDEKPTATATITAVVRIPIRPVQPILPPAALNISKTPEAVPKERTALTTSMEFDDSSPVLDVELARSVVQVLVTKDGQTPPVFRDGSGVIIDSERGLILTSSHVVDLVGADTSLHDMTITIATSLVPGGQPNAAYRAAIVALDHSSEIAVLRVVGEVDRDKAVDGGSDDTVGVRAAPRGLLRGFAEAILGDSSTVKRGDPLWLLGHPGIDLSGAVTSQSMIVTSASMTGERRDLSVESRSWLKTDALMPHGTAGGPVFNSDGELVGIAAQIGYNATVPVSHVRPLQLATQVIVEARIADDGSVYVPLLAHPGGVPGTSRPLREDGIAVSKPAFAHEAMNDGIERHLLDYTLFFPQGTTEVHYEFVLQGVPNGATVQEFWYFNGWFMDRLSSTYRWNRGPFAMVSEVLSSPYSWGHRNGIWTLEVWVDGALRASGQVFLGIDEPLPTFSDLQFASTISKFDVVPDELPVKGALELLMVFEYQGAAAVEYLRWAVSHDNEVVYRSPTVPWRGGNSGTWWIGVQLDDGLSEGNWEFQIWADDTKLATHSFALPEP